MLRYYKEPNGDYLAVNMDAAYVTRHAANSEFEILEGRATAIAGLISSVCTTGISGAFLSGCKRVKRSQVPNEWLEQF